MATSEKEAPRLTKKAGGKKRMTILVMGSIGKVLSFQISPRFFFGSAVFFVAFILFSVYIINGYIHLRRTCSQNDQKAALLEEENANHRKTLSKSRQHIALLEGYIRHLEEGADFSTPGKRETARIDGDRGIPAAASPEKGPKPSQAVDVMDVVIQKEGASMSVNLKLVNTQPGEGAVGGFVHLIAVDKKSNPTKEWPYPQEKLEKGMPSNYRRGQIFLIHKFKQMNVRFQLGSPSESPSAIKVLVYDQSGEILLQKEMEVTKGS
jgi:hypothetical protein